MQVDHPQFVIKAAITGYTIRKSANGEEKYVLQGMASNTNIDLTGERMAISAIEAMAKSLETNKVYLNNEHGDDWDDDFGEVTKLWVNDDHELIMEATLDPDHYRTKTLIKALNKGKQLGLSIGGYVRKWADEWVEEVGHLVTTFKDVTLFHVAITGTPAVADTWVTPITKSVKSWKGMPMPKKEQTDVLKNDEVETTEETTEQVETETSTDPVETTETEEVAKSEEVIETETESEEEAESAETETEAEAEVEAEETTPDPENETEEADAAAQEDEAPAGAEAAPEQAEVTEENVEKSAVLGSWTEADLTETAVDALSWTLQNYIWITMMDEDTSPAEKTSAISAALAEFSELVLKVANSLITSGNADAAKSAAEALEASKPEAVKKSINDLDAQIRVLTRALADTETKLEAAEADVLSKEGELETATTALEEAEKQTSLAKGRKAYVIGKFGELIEEEEAIKSAGKESIYDSWMKSELGVE